MTDLVWCKPSSRLCTSSVNCFSNNQFHSKDPRNDFTPCLSPFYVFLFRRNILSTDLSSKAFCDNNYAVHNVLSAIKYLMRCLSCTSRIITQLTVDLSTVIFNHCNLQRYLCKLRLYDWMKQCLTSVCSCSVPILYIGSVIWSQ